MPQIGAGTTFAYSTNGTTYTSLGKITKFTPAKTTVAKVSIDAFDATTFNGLPVENQIPGWVSPGTWGVDLYNVASVYSTIRALVGVNPTYFKAIKSDGSGYTFQGYISEQGEEIPLKEAMMASITVQIAGGTVASFATTQT